MKVICYGDSNTYGYDPRSWFGERYDPSCRWVDILTAQTGWDIRNEGMNGREIPMRGEKLPVDTDLLIVMLGTNDLLQGRQPKQAALRMEAFLEGLTLEKRKIILIAPPKMAFGEWVRDQKLIEASIQLGECFRNIARRLGVSFVNAGEWSIPLAFDGVHFTEEGHRIFALRLYKELVP